jgi:hypothetical protein
MHTVLIIAGLALVGLLARPVLRALANVWLLVVIGLFALAVVTMIAH